MRGARSGRASIGEELVMGFWRRRDPTPLPADLCVLTAIAAGPPCRGTGPTGAGGTGVPRTPSPGGETQAIEAGPDARPAATAGAPAVADA
jgi:hypothetical protein